MKTLFAVSFAIVAALLLAVSPAQAWSDGSRGHAPADHWAHWGKPAHGHGSHPGFRHHGQIHQPSVPTFTVPTFSVPTFIVPRPVVVFPHAPVFVAPRRAWVPGFYAWTGYYWVWVPGHWR